MNQHYPHNPYAQPKKSHKLRTALIILGVLFVGLVSCTALVGGALDNAVDTPVGVTASSPSARESADPATPSSEPTEDTADPTPAPTKTAPAISRSAEQALGKAEDYLRGQHFSKKGLIEQLVFEGFSKGDATYAATHVTVNWNDQAAAKAQDYLEGQHFSRAGLIEQLEFEGFTHSQAVYGVKKAGL